MAQTIPTAARLIAHSVARCRRACFAPPAGLAVRRPGHQPAGRRRLTCRPSAEHPHPVVLVHGTFADMTVSWNLISPALKQAGYCVFALDYGRRGTGPIERSAQELADFVDRVLAATGAARVSLVGHSQGGMMPRHYLKFLGGTAEVDDLVGLSPSNHGTANPAALFAEAALGCVSCGQQRTGSAFLRNLNAGDETPGDVSYTVVQTRYDEVVIPYSSAFLAGRGTTNVLLQRRCPLDFTDHLGIIYDPAALQWIKNALGRPGPADPGFRPACV
jgi:triacylglycerol lipase